MKKKEPVNASLCDLFHFIKRVYAREKKQSKRDKKRASHLLRYYDETPYIGISKRV